MVCILTCNTVELLGSYKFLSKAEDLKRLITYADYVGGRV